MDDPIICVPCHIEYEEIAYIRPKKWPQNRQDFYQSQNKNTGRECNLCGARGHISTQCRFWKTKMCWHANSHCPWGANCSFAHSEEELRKQK